MKTIILAGGFGTRISEYTDLPKPMITIHEKPMLVHIMEIYYKHGINDFIIALGYKGTFIKNYFKKNKTKFKDYNIELVDTGIETLTGNRVKLLEKYIDEENFMLTYGDGVSNIDINKLVEFHKNHGKIITVTAVHPPTRFGELSLDGNIVKKFQEKPQQLKAGWINGGFFVVNRKFFKLIPNKSTMLEREPLQKASDLGELMAYKHEGFWHCVDNQRDLKDLEKMFLEKNPLLVK